MSTDAGILWFVGMGFRPAVTTPPHRADEVDYPRIVPAPDSDVPFMAKYDALEPFLPSEGYAWGTWIPAAAPAVSVLAAGPILSAAPAAPAGPSVWHPSTPSQPWWPSEPNEPWFPCCIVREPFEPLPQPAPVPLEASAPFLIAAVAAFAIIRRFK